MIVLEDFTAGPCRLQLHPGVEARDLLREPRQPEATPRGLLTPSFSNYQPGVQEEQRGGGMDSWSCTHTQAVADGTLAFQNWSYKAVVVRVLVEVGGDSQATICLVTPQI